MSATVNIAQLSPETSARVLKQIEATDGKNAAAPRTTPSTALATVAMQRSWKSLATTDLDCIVRTAVHQLWNLGRAASETLRNELLPSLREVKRRYAAGQSIGGVGSLEAYLRSLGLNPSTVRSWDMRDKNDQMLKQVVQDIFVDMEIPAQQEQPPLPIPESIQQSRPEPARFEKAASRSATPPQGKSTDQQLREWLQGKYQYTELRPTERARCRAGRYEITIDGLTAHQVKVVSEVLGRFSYGSIFPEAEECPTSSVTPKSRKRVAA